MRLCVHCGILKPYNPDPAILNGTKAKGFSGTKCWSCKCIASNIWKQNNLDKARYSVSQWKKNNPNKAAANAAKHRALKIQAMPLWADANKISNIYNEAFKKGLTVDHIIPITHPLVCGLHVHNNLQLLSLSENSSKSNKFEVI